jgi:hypothetical protein
MLVGSGPMWKCVPEALLELDKMTCVGLQGWVALGRVLYLLVSCPGRLIVLNFPLRHRQLFLLVLGFLYMRNSFLLALAQQP